MKPVILDNISFEPTPEAVNLILDTKLGRRSAEDFQKLIEEGRELAKPRVLYKVVYVNEKGKDYVKVGRQTFTSRVLRQNLENVHRLFLYVATCGRELDAWKKSKPGALEQYYASAVNELALTSAREYFIAHLEKKYELKKTTSMAPGSLPDWPITEQRPLFALLGDAIEDIGVRLLDSLLMDPGETVSGIRYPAESTFASCELCQRGGCPNRVAPYNAEEYAKRFSSV